MAQREFMRNGMVLSFEGEVESSAIAMTLISANLGYDGTVRASNGRYLSPDFSVSKQGTNVWRINHNLNTQGFNPFFYTIQVTPTYVATPVYLVVEPELNYMIVRSFNHNGNPQACSFSLRIEKI